MLESKKILDYVKGEQEKFLKILGDVVQLESPTYGRKEIKNKCGQYIKSLFQSLNFDIEIIDKGDTGFHISGKLGEGKEKILLVGHYDTVFPEGSLETMPFYRKGNKAYGPGIFDMKGGIIEFYMALKALSHLNLLPDKEINIFFNADEESGSMTSKDLIIEKAKEAKACLVTEPGLVPLGSVKALRYGRAIYKITAHGVAGHAGNHPENASNPFIELSNQLLKINQFNDYEAGLTFTPVSFHGGEQGATAFIPETAYMILDIRFKEWPLYDKVKAVINHLEPVLDKMTLDITGEVEKPPIEKNAGNTAVLQRACEIAKELDFEIIPENCGGGSDGNFTASAGCGTLDGLGLNGEFLHNPREYIIIDTIPKRTALVAELIRTL